jgi:hypothetical protein
MVHLHTPLSPTRVSPPPSSPRLHVAHDGRFIRRERLLSPDRAPEKGGTRLTGDMAQALK